MIVGPTHGPNATLLQIRREQRDKSRRNYHFLDQNNMSAQRFTLAGLKIWIAVLPTCAGTASEL